MSALCAAEKLPLLGFFFLLGQIIFKYLADWKTGGLRANSITQHSFMIEYLQRCEFESYKVEK